MPVRAAYAVATEKYRTIGNADEEDWELDGTMTGAEADESGLQADFCELQKEC